MHKQCSKVSVHVETDQRLKGILTGNLPHATSPQIKLKTKKKDGGWGDGEGRGGGQKTTKKYQKLVYMDIMAYGPPPTFFLRPI